MRPTDGQIVQALDLCLAALWKQQDELQRLGMRYPEAYQVLGSPRKPDAIVILERLRHALSAAPTSDRPTY
jgi:hypothetical protein